MQLKLVDHKKAPNSKNSEIDLGNRLNNRTPAMVYLQNSLRRTYAS
jgi:hypothetical protein